MSNKYDQILSILQRDTKISRGGISAIAIDINMKETFLADKLNPNNDRKLNFDEFVDVVTLSNSVATISAIAYLMGKMIIDIPKCNGSKGDVFQQFLTITKESGDVGAEIQKAMHVNSENGLEISSTEKQKILKELKELKEAVICLEYELKG